MMIEPLNKDQQIVLVRAVEQFGEARQSMMLIEECAELISEIARFPRQRFNRANVAEEIADVYIMIQQAAGFVGADLVNASIKAKIQRLKDTIEDDQA